MKHDDDGFGRITRAGIEDLDSLSLVLRQSGFPGEIASRGAPIFARMSAQRRPDRQKKPDTIHGRQELAHDRTRLLSGLSINESDLLSEQGNDTASTTRWAIRKN
jgi:hypothetical protein